MERRLDRDNKTLKGDKSILPEIELIQKILEVLNQGKSARTLEYTPEEQDILRDIPLLSRKPIIYAANIDDSEIAGDPMSNPYYVELKKIADGEHSGIISICAQLEAEIAALEEDEREEFLKELGLPCSGLDKLISACYSLLGLISFLTAGPEEVRAWTITKGTRAPQAAGKIHTDFERGFIRAEVVAYDDLVTCGSLAAAREKGLMRSEGKEYVMTDGDGVLFRFNV